MGSSTCMIYVLTKWWDRNTYPVFIRHDIFWLFYTYQVQFHAFIGLTVAIKAAITETAKNHHHRT